MMRKYLDLLKSVTMTEAFDFDRFEEEPGFDTDYDPDEDEDEPEFANGFWITADGTYLACDYENDRHHADIAMDHFVIPVGSKDEINTIACAAGWIRILDHPAGQFAMEINPKTVSEKALRHAMREINTESTGYTVEGDFGYLRAASPSEFRVMIRRLVDRHRSLTEAPIGDITHHGDMNTPGTLDWRYTDEPDNKTRRMVNSPAHQFAVRRVFQNAPIIIDIAYCNAKSENTTPDNKELDAISGKWVSREELLASIGFDVKSNPKALTFMISNNFGDKAVPLTPWMIAHRMSHAIEEAGRNAKNGDVWDDVDGTFRDVARTLIEPMGETKRYGDPADVARALGTTSAFRDTPKSGRWGEWYHEAFAQYLLQGHIRLRSTKDAQRGFEARWGSGPVVIKELTDAELESLDAKLRSALDKMESYFARLLKAHVGHGILCL